MPDPTEPAIDISLDRMLQFFAYAQLPMPLQAVSRPFSELAVRMVQTLPRNPERTVMLRKLIEAKDCALRALIYAEPEEAHHGAVA